MKESNKGVFKLELPTQSTGILTGDTLIMGGSNPQWVDAIDITIKDTNTLPTFGNINPIRTFNDWAEMDQSNLSTIDQIKIKTLVQEQKDIDEKIYDIFYGITKKETVVKGKRIKLEL